MTTIITDKDEITKILDENNHRIGERGKIHNNNYVNRREIGSLVCFDGREDRYRVTIIHQPDCDLMDTATRVNLGLVCKEHSLAYEQVVYSPGAFRNIMTNVATILERTAKEVRVEN